MMFKTVLLCAAALALPYGQQEQQEQQFTDVYQDSNTGAYYEFDPVSQEYFQVDPAQLDFYPDTEEAAANFQAAVESEQAEYEEEADYDDEDQEEQSYDDQEQVQEEQFYDQDQQEDQQEQQYTDVYQDTDTGAYYEFDQDSQQYFQVDPAQLDFIPNTEEDAANFQAAVEAEQAEQTYEQPTQEFESSDETEVAEYEERVPQTEAAWGPTPPSLPSPPLESAPIRKRRSYPSLKSLRQSLFLGPRWTLSQISNHMSTVSRYARRIVGLTEELKGFMSNSAAEFAEKYPKAAARIKKHRKSKKAKRQRKAKKAEEDEGEKKESGEISVVDLI